MNGQINVGEADKERVCHMVATNHRYIHLVQGKNNTQCCHTPGKFFLVWMSNECDSDHGSENEIYLDFPCTVSAQPVFIYMTNMSSQSPNFARDEGYVGIKQWVAEQGLYAFECQTIEQTNWLLGGSLTCQPFA